MIFLWIFRGGNLCSSLKYPSKENAYPLDLLEVTIDSKNHITLGKSKDTTLDVIFDYVSVSCLKVTLKY